MEKIPFDIDKIIQQFDASRVFRLRGKAHEGIIGEWIRWWLDFSPQNYVSNPAPYLNTKSADILFLSLNQDMIHVPIGVAEIENNANKWYEKAETLNQYISSTQYPDLKFALLCVTVNPRSKTKKEMFQRLLKYIKNTSMKTKHITWILCRLEQGAPRKEECILFLGEEEKQSTRFISAHNIFLVNDGKVKS